MPSLRSFTVGYLCVGNKAVESKAVSSLLAPRSCATEELEPIVIHFKDPIPHCSFYPWRGDTNVLTKAGYINDSSAP